MYLANLRVHIRSDQGFHCQLTGRTEMLHGLLILTGSPESLPKAILESESIFG
jgi:hypothetical protein